MTVEEINQIAKLLALTPTQRERFHELMQPLPKVSAASWLSADAAGQLAVLKSSISAADSAKIDPKRIPALNRIKAILRRVGYGALGDSEILDGFKLDQVLAKSGESIESRIAIKLDLGRLGLLPRLA